jgi:hypothetical protein
MKQNKIFQLWSYCMAKMPKKNKSSNKLNLITVELIPVNESEAEHQNRVENVQIILTQMYLRLLKRGRPVKNEEEELYAA